MRLCITLLTLLMIAGGSRGALAQAPEESSLHTGFSQVNSMIAVDNGIAVRMDVANNCGEDGAVLNDYMLVKNHPNYETMSDLIISAYETRSSISVTYHCMSGEETGAEIETVAMKR